MQQLVRDMRVGSKIILGRYSCDKDAEPQAIVWLKASPDSKFIAQDALDYLCFDARELTGREEAWRRYGNGNADYSLSNIHTYLNSEDEEWFVAQHEPDTPPDEETAGGYCSIGVYNDHYGFLKHFEDYEIGALLCDTFNVGGAQIEARVRLPMSGEIIGDDKFMLFNRKGIRVHPSLDLAERKGLYSGYSNINGYMPYVMADRHERWPDYLWQMDTGCYMGSTQPSSLNGIRPVIKLDPCARVDKVDKDTYELVPTGAAQINVWSGDDFMSLLGLV